MELHHFDGVVLGEEAGDLASYVGFAGSGRTVEDHLTLVFQEPLDAAEVVHVEEKGIGELPENPRRFVGHRIGSIGNDLLAASEIFIEGFLVLA